MSWCRSSGGRCDALALRFSTIGDGDPTKNRNSRLQEAVRVLDHLIEEVVDPAEYLDVLVDVVTRRQIDCRVSRLVDRQESRAFDISPAACGNDGRRDLP